MSDPPHPQERALPQTAADVRLSTSNASDKRGNMLLTVSRDSKQRSPMAQRMHAKHAMPEVDVLHPHLVPMHVGHKLHGGV